MIKHDLIEQVGGIEVARGIVEDAPVECAYYSLVNNIVIYYQWSEEWYWYNSNTSEYERDFSKSMKFCLNDLRTAIAEHDQTSVLPTLDQEFKRGDLIVYHSIESHKNLFSVRYVGGDSITVYECLDEMGAKTFSENKPYSDIRHATPEEIKAGRRLDDTTDHCSDIRNHLSPNTKVIDHG
ncbi:hypothetical protein EXU29_12250 [Acinetobacter wuhouensis]|uniref:hypothetical protein n=1 Tax=Acinetobacter wuhouensis TaxID=1879050 RepID=UPI0010236D04|nr:hypothetical protein [Acinetobacter wuhouensis]RZG71891.1 hypothetical protein EXU29_12250 [Acinetobacter wuhouensis]